MTGTRRGAGLLPEASSVVETELGRAESPEDAFAPSVQRLLHLLRLHLGMETAWTSEFIGSQQVFRFVDAATGAVAPEPGSRTPLSSAYCTNVLAGRMPSIIPDARREPMAVLLPVTFDLQIGSYIGVPLTGLDGSAAGMLCVVSNAPSPALSERDLASAQLIAQVIDDLHRRALGAAAAQRQHRALCDAVTSICSGQGRRAVLQPIVEVATGAAVAAEGLTRFADASRTPAEWFAAADTVGLRRELEVATARAVVATVTDAAEPPAVTVNLSPDVVVAGHLDDLLAGTDPRRVVVEITEHAPVASYEALHEALRPFRSSGLRIAVDDAGAGYASLTHVLRLRPELIKVDMSLVRCVDGDPVRRTLIAAIQDFARSIDAHLVAEGVETPDELAALSAIGVPYAQGYLFGMPTDAPRWRFEDVVPGRTERADRPR